MSDTTISAPTRWQSFSDWVKWLILGHTDELPQFMMRHLKGLIRSYECQVCILIESLSEFSKIKDTSDTNDASEPSKSQIDEILKQFKKERDLFSSDQYNNFQNLLKIDAKLIAIMPKNFLLARRWLIIDRFRRIAPAQAIMHYESSFPPSINEEKSSEPKNIRADLLNISNYMQQLYVLNIQREKSLASIKWWLLTRTMVLIIVTSAIFLLITTNKPNISWWLDMPAIIFGLAIIFLIGNIGAVVSISRKFQGIAKNNILKGDPFNELISLESGRPSVAVSIMSGGIFALFLYLLVATGSIASLGLQHQIFPTVVNQTIPPARAATPIKPLVRCAIAKCENGNVPHGIRTISEAMGFGYAADILRMMLLAFLAGFAERLVPDSIDRLIKREKDAHAS